MTIYPLPVYISSIHRTCIVYPLAKISLSISWCVSCTIHAYHVFKHMLPSQSYSFLTYTFLVHILCSHIMLNTHTYAILYSCISQYTSLHTFMHYMFLNQCYHYLSVHTIFSMVIITCHKNLSYQFIHLIHYLLLLYFLVSMHYT